MKQSATVETMSRLIGAEGYIRDRGMDVNVRVIDARQSYGNIHVLIAPLSGSGSTWTTAESVQLHPRIVSVTQSRSSLEAAERAWSTGKDRA